MDRWTMNNIFQFYFSEHKATQKKKKKAEKFSNDFETL